MLPWQLYISRQRGFMCWGDRVFLRTVLQVSCSIIHIHTCMYYVQIMYCIFQWCYGLYSSYFITVFLTWLLSKYYLFLASSSLLRVVWVVSGRSSSVLPLMAAFCMLPMVHVWGVWVCGCGCEVCGCGCVGVHALTNTQQHTGSVSTGSSKEREWNVSRWPLPLPEWSEWIYICTNSTH